LDKLRLPHKHRRQPEVRIQGLKRRRIPLAQHSSRLRRDSKHPLRTCRRGSNRHRRRENSARQDNLRRLERQAQLPVPQQLVQQVPLLPLRVLLRLLHRLRNSPLDFWPATG